MTEKGRPPQIHPEMLASFLIRAKRACYAGGKPADASSRPASRDLHYEESEHGLLYIDSYLGQLSFAGEEAVWKDGFPVWAMNYCGVVTGEGFSSEFLKQALYEVPKDAPYRGPIEFQRDDNLYTNNYAGDMRWFFGREEIYHRGVNVYTCMYHGSLIIE